MIAWLNDTEHLWKSTLMVCPGFDFALSARMMWSKIMSNERDAPHQILLASMDANYKILLAFGLALEVIFDCCK
eukprot:3841725-Ditylum_brightwellii.AAC.1